jgi:hypothetical protein
VLTKTNWTKQNKTTVQSSHPHPLSSETILVTLNKQLVTASPFKLPENEEERKIVEQNNYTNKCLNIIGDCEGCFCNNDTRHAEGDHDVDSSFKKGVVEPKIQPRA